MKLSLLQKERAAYQPKLPKGLQGAVKVCEGEPTQSVGDQEEIKALFPNTYGMPLVEFVPGNESCSKKMNVGVILSGGQAPGGHNVICGIDDHYPIPCKSLPLPFHPFHIREYRLQNHRECISSVYLASSRNASTYA